MTLALLRLDCPASLRVRKQIDRCCPARDREALLAEKEVRVVRVGRDTLVQLLLQNLMIFIEKSL